MAALILAAALAAARPPVSARADPTARWDGFIVEAAARARIPQDWVRRVMRAESAGQVSLDERPIVSHAGAMGLMQLMPATWSELRAELALGHDPFDPHDNILAGATFLRRMYDRFGYPGLFGAYNAGPARYAAHLRGAALPAETRAYLTEVAGQETVQARAEPVARPVLFVTGSGGNAGAPAEGAQAAMVSALFVIRHNPVAERAEDAPSMVGK